MYLFYTRLRLDIDWLYTGRVLVSNGSCTGRVRVLYGFSQVKPVQNPKNTRTKLLFVCLLSSL